ncbi:MAG TPA: hypothetical protein VG994_02615 [Steroidobacteraceae bacterium]|nr:hypothetical protein [Steroidobacteraceae bacterium]
MTTELYRCETPDGHRLRVDRVAGCLAITVRDHDAVAATALTADQERELMQALAAPLIEQVRSVMAAIDECRDPVLAATLRAMLHAHLAPHAARMQLEAL